MKGHTGRDKGRLLLGLFWNAGIPDSKRSEVNARCSESATTINIFANDVQIDTLIRSGPLAFPIQPRAVQDEPAVRRKGPERKPQHSYLWMSGLGMILTCFAYLHFQTFYDEPELLF